jgi:hypothetical protein
VTASMGNAKHWKTTVQGFLGAIMAVSLMVTQNPQNPFSFLPAKFTVAIVAAGAIAKVIIATFFQTDGTQTTVNLPVGGAPLDMTIPPGSTATVKTPEK